MALRHCALGGRYIVLQAGCHFLIFAVVLLAGLAQTGVWLFIEPLFMLVWQAGACSHDGLTYQTLLPCTLGCHSFGCLQAQLIRY